MLIFKLPNFPPDAAQPGTTNLISTSSTRVQSAVWKDGKLWLAFNDGCFSPGDTLARSCYRLINIDTTASSPHVIQDFDVDTSGSYLFFPALSITNQGDLIVIYGISSSTLFPSLQISGQTANPTSSELNTLIRPAITLREGEANAQEACSRPPVSSPTTPMTCRIGDYFGAGTDPVTQSITWIDGEHYRGQHPRLGLLL